MDQKLVAWGRAVKARRRGLGRCRCRCRCRCLAPLWLFTDEARMGEVGAVIAGLPVGLCGVVFRHDGVAGRAALLRSVARLCRQRRLALVVAGDAPAWAGRHLRGGFGPRGRRGLVTSSAHDVADLVRARRAGAGLAFLSPAFATESHRGTRPLGVLRWAAMARRAGLPVLALGGIDGGTVRLLPRWAGGAGAIGALLP